MKIIIILLLLITAPVLSQDKLLKASTFEGIFAFESDDRLRSLDDMIFRKSAILISKKNKLKCNNTIFIFETSTIPLNLRNFNDDEKEKIRKSSNFFNDSIHDLFKAKQTKIIIHKEFEYKLFNMKFKAVYLGKVKHSIRKNNKFSEKKKDTYLIYDFIKIDTVK